jgi:hypothetical protein
LKTPKLAELAERTQNMLLSKIQLDVQLYKAVESKWRNLMSKQGDDFWEEVEQFKLIQQSLSRICSLHNKHPVCRWYSLDDLAFYNICKNGQQIEAVPFC